MAFDLFGGTESVLIIIIFILFILAFKKALQIIKNSIFIAVASALFPIVTNWFGLPVAADIASVIFFITLGLGLYVFYIITKSVYTILGAAEKGVKKISKPRNGKKKE